MAMQPGINCINLAEDSSHVVALKEMADRLGLAFRTIGNPRQMDSYTYLVWIGSEDLSSLLVWLNRIDFSCGGSTRIAWFPAVKHRLSLPVALDFALVDSELKGIEQLITAQQKAFSPFFDHISGLAFKNALGRWTFNPK
jgi:hypothetical protein